MKYAIDGVCSLPEALLNASQHDAEIKKGGELKGAATGIGENLVPSKNPATQLSRSMFSTRQTSVPVGLIDSVAESATVTTSTSPVSGITIP